MDNGNEINEEATTEVASEAQTTKLVDSFLSAELKSLEKARASSYDLETEYAKTKKNRQIAIFVIMGVCLVGIALALISTYHYVVSSNNEIEINIDSFEDLNLKGLLSSVGRTQNSLGAAKKQKRELESSMNFDLSQAKEKRDNDIFTIESLNLKSKKDEKNRIEVVEKNYEVALKNIHDFYDEKIATADAEIKKYENEMGEFDAEKLSAAQDRQNSLDSESRLHQLEMERNDSRYENQISNLRKTLSTQQKESVKSQRAAVKEVQKKYQAEIDALDPVLKDEKADEIISKAKTDAEPIGGKYNADRYSSGVSGKVKNAIEETKSLYENFDYIGAQVSAIPQEHSIPSYVQAMKDLTYQIGSTLSEASAEENRALQERNRFIENFLESSLRIQNQRHAVVIDSSSGEFEVYIAKQFRFKVTEDAPTQCTVSTGRTSVTAEISSSNGKYFVKAVDAKNQSLIAVGQTILFRDN